MAEKKIEDIKTVHPYWYNAMIKALDIVLNRTPKYNGNAHPYRAFSELSSYYPLMEDWKIFAETLKLKFARLNGSANDFTDESLIDTYLDIANYALIAAGWLMKDEDITLYDLHERNVNFTSNFEKKLERIKKLK